MYHSVVVSVGGGAQGVPLSGPVGVTRAHGVHFHVAHFHSANKAPPRPHTQSNGGCNEQWATLYCLDHKWQTCMFILL